MGLSLDFLFGHGYLSVRDRRLGDWATLDALRMEIPDLSFPFDARGGVGRFRNTRCHVREIRMTVSESGLLAAMGRALDEIDGFFDLQLRFGDGAAHAVVRLTSMGSDTWITFKLGAMRPEPPRGDIVHLLVHDVRAYGPVPYPARLLVSELIARLLASEAMSRPGRGRAFDVAHRGDLIELRPLKLGLLSLFPLAGWKMPDLSGVRLESVNIHPGALTIAARTAVPQHERGSRDTLGEVGVGRGAAEALAAYEARDLCKSADEALWSGELEAAVGALQGLREVYGAHRSITSRLLDALLASPGAAFVVEARVLVEELLRADPDDTCALTAAPTIHLMRGERREAVAAYAKLAAVLRERGETVDLITCLLASAATLKREDPGAAVAVLQEVLALAPRDRRALELVRDLYYELDRTEELTDVLRRLSTLVTERDAIIAIYQELAELLMHRRHDLVEARIYLEKVLALEPGRVDALVSMGDSYALDDQPLRALKVFGSAARAAAERGDDAQAARLHLRIAQLWSGPLGEPSSALVSTRRALSHVGDHRKALRLGIDLALSMGQPDAALGFVERLVPLVEAELDSAAPEAKPNALAAARAIHLKAAEVALARGREDACAAHHRRALAFRRHPDAKASGDSCPSFDFLDRYLRQSGRPEDLLDLYRAELEGDLEPVRQAALHERLAVVFDEVLRVASEAVTHLRLALDLEPSRLGALDHLSRLLTRDRRYGELRDTLVSLESQVADRVARASVLLRLGRLQTHSLVDPAAGVATLRRAQALRPAEPEIAAALVESERLALPIGGDPRPLLAALERLGEVGEDDDVRHGALVEAGDVCADRLEALERAASFWRRAATIRADPGVEERLARFEPPTPTPAPRAPAPGSPEVVALQDVPVPDVPALPPMPEEPGLLDPSKLNRPRSDESVAELAEEIGLNLESAIGDLDGFREQLAKVQVESASLAESRAVLSKLSKRSGTQVSIPAPAPTAAQRPPEGATRPVASLNREVFSNLHRARQAGDSEALRDALEAALFLPELPDEDRASFCSELGQLYYYDLEQNGAARERLLEAVALDPEGTGRNEDVLTALEGVYEDLDDPEGLRDVYGRRIAATSDADMKKVYGLLLADLLEERLGLPAEAEEALQGVLAIEPGNVPAAQGLARLAAGRGDTSAAIVSLRPLLAEFDRGEYERAELVRQLAGLLGRHADRAEQDPALQPGATEAREEAAALWGELLAESSSDTEALGALRGLLPQLGRYVEALGLVGAELGMLLGRGDVFRDEIDASTIDENEVPEALRFPVSQILADAGALTERAGDAVEALSLYGHALRVWPENIEVLGAKIALGRRRVADGASGAELADDLEAMAAFLLDDAERDEHLAEATRLRAGETAQALTVKSPSLSRPTDLSESDDDSPWPAGEFPLSSGERRARPPAAELPPPTRLSGGDSNPFGLPSIDPASMALDSGDATPVLDERYALAMEAPTPDFSEESRKVDVTSALDRAARAEQAGERDELLEWLDLALASLDPSDPLDPTLRRQLHVRRALAFLGHTPPGTPSDEDKERALEAADAALAVDQVEEPEAHFARAAALTQLARTDEAIDALVALARLLGDQSPENLGDADDIGDDGSDLDLEKRIVDEALGALTAGRAVDRRDHVLYRLSAANDRVRIVIEREKLL